MKKNILSLGGLNFILNKKIKNKDLFIKTKVLDNIKIELNHE